MRTFFLASPLGAMLAWTFEILQGLEPTWFVGLAGCCATYFILEPMILWCKRKS